MMRVLDLFSGIGGFSLGLERTGGFKTVAFCEIDKFCQRVLAKHWPGVPIYDDIKELTAARLAADGIAVDVICGGFPCQDVSFAGKRAGLEGARSGLWSEYGRLIGEVRPQFVIVENVPGLLSLGMGAVLGDLAALGLDAVWDCIPASAIGAPHRRDRVWFVAHRNNKPAELNVDVCRDEDSSERDLLGGCSSPLAYASGARLSLSQCETIFGVGRREEGRAIEQRRDVSDAASQRRNATRPERSAAANGSGPFREPSRSDWWSVEPDVGRVAHGVPSRVDRLRALGNAVVPHIPELIGRAILEACHD